MIILHTKKTRTKCQEKEQEKVMRVATQFQVMYRIARKCQDLCLVAAAMLHLHPRKCQDHPQVPAAMLHLHPRKCQDHPQVPAAMLHLHPRKCQDHPRVPEATAIKLSLRI